MSPYQGAEHELYQEAIRVVAGVMAARTRGDKEDILSLHLGFKVTATELGIPSSTAWSILYSAALTTTHGLVNLVAEVQQTPASEVTQRLVFAAVEQVATGAF